MELDEARVLVCGASGALGGQIADRLEERGARLVVAGRDRGRLRERAERYGTEAVVFDAVDADSCTRTVEAAVAQLGGLDGIVVTVGVAGFGRAVEADAAVTEELFAVNALGPMSLVRAAAAHLERGGFVAVLSAILADLPTAGMAEYSASKSALSTWLEVVRREERRGFRVLDVRPPHLDTSLETRALAGEAPALPNPFASSAVADAVVQAIAEDKREITFDLKAGALVVR